MKQIAILNPERIHSSLRHVFERNRLVFWYDATGEWTSVFDAYMDEKVVKLKVAGNEFSTKVRVVRDPDPATRFLLYIPTTRPADADNWLLDLLLQGYEYKADKASLILQEVGLPHEFRHIAEEHADFFRNAKRIQAFKELIAKDDESPQLRLKMMAVLAGTDVDLDALLLQFLAKGADAGLIDPVLACLDAASLVKYFWTEVQRIFGYAAATPSIRDFAVSLFRGANPLDDQVGLHPHGKVFLQRWKDSQEHRVSFHEWSRQMERELQISDALNRVQDNTSLGSSDTFEVFDKFTLHRLCEGFQKGTSAVDLRAEIQQRRTSFWQPEHKHGYAAIEYAVEFRELLASAELAIDSLSSGVNRYLSSWWRIDKAYRLCMWNLRQYGQVHLMEPIFQWVEKTYVNNFLLLLADRWSDQVCRLKTWECDAIPAQRTFFDNYVQPFLTKGQKVFVIISDALRYEAAADFAQRLQSANRWTAEVEALFGSLPTYTQLGMASLLPGSEWTIEPSGNAVVDGRSASGTPNRAEILRARCGARATALQAEDFLELNTKMNGRALMRDHDVIYIFHNVIDKTGDARATEVKTLDAVEDAFEELELIIKKVANINGNNMLLTADHGFIFQQDDVDDGDMTAFPNAEKWTYPTRRFALGRGVEASRDVKLFTPQELKLNGDWIAAFPLSLGRFPIAGSGKRFVHGGISLQEVIIPVVKIHKARTDDTEHVDVELLRVPAKITTGQISVSLFQKQPAIGKVLPRTLRVGLFAKDGTAISEIKTQTFDSKETEARQRESIFVLTLSHEADAFNNREVDLRLEETLQGTNQIVIYKAHTLKLQKPFTSDFDEH